MTAVNSILSSAQVGRRWHGGGHAVRLNESKVGLLAGWGRYPVTLAQCLKRQGRHVCALGVKDHADPALADVCDDFAWVGLSKLGRVIRYFRRHGRARSDDGRKNP